MRVGLATAGNKMASAPQMVEHVRRDIERIITGFREKNSPPVSSVEYDHRRQLITVFVDKSPVDFTFLRVQLTSVEIAAHLLHTVMAQSRKHEFVFTIEMRDGSSGRVLDSYTSP